MALGTPMRGEDAQILEEAARPGTYRQRRVHCIEYWLSRGLISDREAQAAERFFLDYQHAQLTPKPATARLERIDGGGEEPTWRLDRRRAAYADVQQALALVGPRAREPVECIVGQRMGLKEYCLDGSSIRQAEVRAVLYVGLSLLASYYGLT